MPQINRGGHWMITADYLPKGWVVVTRFEPGIRLELFMTGDSKQFCPE